MFRPQEQQRKRIFQLAAQLEQDLSQEGFGRELLSSASLTRLLVTLMRFSSQREENQPSPLMPESQRNYEIMRYLDAHLQEEVDIDSLAEHFFISKYYMMRSFRRETGMTILSYLTQKRLMLARMYMDAGMSATESCYRCGFGSYSSFTRAYRQHCGTTPTGRTGRSLVREEGIE